MELAEDLHVVPLKMPSAPRRLMDHFVTCPNHKQQKCWAPFWCLPSTGGCGVDRRGLEGSKRQWECFKQSWRGRNKQTNRANQNKQQEAAPGASPGAGCQQTGWVLRASTAPTGNGLWALEKGHQVMAWQVPVSGGLGEHWGRRIYINICIYWPFCGVGRCELAVAVPVGTGH